MSEACNPDVLEKVTPVYALSRLETTDATAKVMAFLASNTTRRVTGQTLRVSGVMRSRDTGVD